MHEQWRPVVGHEGYYEVSNKGRIRSLAREGVYPGRWRPTFTRFPARTMKISSTRAGYQYVALKMPNKPGIKYLVHRLVMRAFSGEFPPDRPQVNHIDGNKANNAIENLEFSSSLENLRHCIDVLGKKRGEVAGHAKLTESQVIAILADTRLLREVAADYGVSMTVVSNIKNGKSWRYLTQTIAKTRELKRQEA